MNHEDCLKFKSNIDGRIGYSKIDSLYKIDDTVGLGSYSEVLTYLKQGILNRKLS